MSKNKVKVAVTMITYNHERFINDAIKGVLLQKTNFDYKLFITDDNSPDRTAEICKEYALKHPDKIEFESFSKNIGGARNWHYTLSKCKNSKADFVAICDGDDYWTDPHKLQMQVDFLEKNLEFNMVHTDFDIFYNKNMKLVPKRNLFYKIPISYNQTYDELLLKNNIATLSVLFRNDFENFLDYSILPDLSNYKLGDYPLWLIISRNKNVGYINKSTATYRVLESSASNHGQDIEKKYEFDFSEIKMKFDLIDKLGCKKETKESIEIDFYKLNLNYGFLKKDLTLSKEYYLKLKEIGKSNFDDKLKVIGSKSAINWHIIKNYLRIKNKLKRMVNKTQG